SGQGTVDFEFVIRREDAAFEFVRSETVAALERAGMPQHLIDGANFVFIGARSGVTEETISGEGHAIAQAAAEDLADRDSPGLAEKIEAGKFEGRQNLCPIVVQ